MTTETATPKTAALEGPTPEGAAAFDALVRRLSRQSVDKHFGAYEDVAWDDPALALDPADPRFVLWPEDPLAATGWYRGLPPERQAQVGLARVAVGMRTGWEFENVLQRGLLAHAYRLGNGRPEFRYLHHEVIEESQHSMMFQEFVNRTGLEVAGMPRSMKRVAELLVLPTARWFPELFFCFVLGGEDPIDHVQRLRLRAGGGHPLVERIMRIHVTEEARHLSFARSALKQSVPRLGPVRRTVLTVAVPLLLGVMARQMLLPSPAFARAVGLPRPARREAARSPEAAVLVRDSVAKVRRLCGDLGLLTTLSRPVWRLVGLAEESSGAR